MVTNTKLAFTNIPFRHNSACVMIKKLLRFRRVITVIVRTPLFLKREGGGSKFRLPPPPEGAKRGESMVPGQVFLKGEADTFPL